MSQQRLDADTAETVAGVIRLLRRGAELVWVAVDADAAGSPRQVLALGITAADYPRPNRSRPHHRHETPGRRRSRSSRARPATKASPGPCATKSRRIS
jgi:hypothetical protein